LADLTTAFAGMMFTRHQNSWKRLSTERALPHQRTFGPHHLGCLHRIEGNELVRFWFESAGYGARPNQLEDEFSGFVD